MKKKLKLKFIFEKVFSSLTQKIDLIKSPQDIADARKLLPELDIPKSETVLPDGTIVKSLFLDYFSDQEYLIAKIIKRARKQYEKEVKEFDTISAGGAEKTTVKKSQPSLPFLGYN
jgi:pantothenate kinase type III